MRAPRTIVGLLRAAAVVFAVAIAAAGAARADSPELVASVGSTITNNGEPGSGGAAGGLGLMFPVDRRWAFGAMLFVDDLGTGLADLRDPNTGDPLGTVANLHRWSFGGEWRAEVTLHDARRARVLWGAGFGYGRQERDQRGAVTGAASSITASTSASFLMPAAHGHAFGVTLAARHAFVNTDGAPDRATDWATAAFEWRWQGTPKE